MPYAAHFVCWQASGYLTQRVVEPSQILGAAGHDGHGRTTVERAVSHFPDAGVVVFGHSHVPLIEQRGAVLLVNPGSPTDRRSQPRFSCARLTLDGGVAAAELITWGP